MIDFEVWHDTGVGLVQPIGVLDGAAVPYLRDALSDAARLAKRPLTVIVDGQITAMDPAPISALLVEHARLRNLGGTLAIVGTAGRIAHLMRISGLAHGIPVFDSLQDALTTLTRKAEQ